VEFARLQQSSTLMRSSLLAIALQARLDDSYGVLNPKPR
jgi:hypothetical protein